MSLMRDRFGWRHGLIGAFAVALTLSLPIEADAKRIGGGGSAGMKRSAPVQSSPATPPKQASQPQSGTQNPSPTQAAPAAGAAGAAAAAPARRSWMGPIAGLAAGLGLAALMSHLGLGEAFANFLMLALLGVAAIFLVGFLMRRFGRGAGSQPAMASAGAGEGASASRPLSVAMPPAERAQPAATPVLERSAFTPAAADVSVTGRPLGQPLQPVMAGAAAEEPVAVMPAAQGRWVDPLVAPKLPDGFDLPAFERIAKMIFIRMQAANDAADLDDLRNFTTPEMFAAVRLDIQDRGAKAQHTDVERVDASVVDFAQEDGRHIVSVRFQGLIREEQGAPAAAFDEVWHLVKPEGEGSWAIAGIQQSQ